MLYIMATCPVRFVFYCGEEELQYTHNLPRSLVSARGQAAKDAGYNNLFVGELGPIMKEHEASCLGISNALCGNCGSPRTKVLQTPMSWLHKVDDPFVAVWVVSGRWSAQLPRTAEKLAQTNAVTLVFRLPQSRGSIRGSIYAAGP